MDTRKSLEDEVLSWLDESGDTGETQTNVRNAIKQAHIKRLTETEWPFLLWPDEEQFSLVPGQRNYTLHSEYWKPLYFWDETQDRELNERPMRNIRPEYRDEQYKFVLWNRSPVAAHPSAASKLTLVSSDTSDVGSTSGAAVLVRGVTASGVRQEVVNMTGTTPVDTRYTYSPGGILLLSKTGTWEGDLTVTAGATAVVVLGADEVARSYQQIKTLWTPSNADVINYQFFRKPNPLDYDYSIPDIPEPFGRILVWDALLLLATYDGQIDAARKSVWETMQSEMDTAMRQTYLDGQSLRAEPQGIHYIDED